MRRQPIAGVTTTGSDTVRACLPSTCTVTNVPMGRRVSVRTTWTDRFGPQSLTLTTIVSQVTNPS